MHKTRIDIPQEQRTKLIELLNARLSDSLDLYFQTKHAHWNVKGPSFIALHEMFDEFAESLESHADTIAERVTALGGNAEGLIGTVSKRTKLPTYPSSIVTGLQHVDALATSYAAYCKAVREAIEEATKIDDADTADLFTGISREADKQLWFLEAHLQAEK